METFSITTTDNDMNIDIDGDPIRLIPQVIVYVVNFLGVETLGEAREFIIENKDYTIDIFLQKYPLSKNLSLKVTAINEESRIITKNVKDEKTLKNILIVALLTMDYEQRFFIIETIELFFEDTEDISNDARIKEIIKIFHL